MIIQTDVTCLYCGHVSWRVELERGEPWQLADVVWPEGTRLPARPQCTRCGGPVYLDQDYRRVRVRNRDWQTLVEQVRAASRTPAALASPGSRKQLVGSPELTEDMAA